MPTPQEARAELERRRNQQTEGEAQISSMSTNQMAAIEELRRRGRNDLVRKVSRPAFLKQAMDEVASELGPLDAFLYGAGRGISNVARGVGVTMGEESGVAESISEQRPVATIAGEITGEAAPFLIPATGTARLATVPGRVGRVMSSAAGRMGAAGTIGGAEGAIIQRGKGEDPILGGGTGAGVAVGAELLLPVLGRLGRKVFQRVTGRVPEGAMLDAAGRPTKELQEALSSANMDFDDLTEDAVEVIQRQKAGAAPEQVSRAAMFAEEGIPASKGDIMQASPGGFEQQATEQRLLESTRDKAADRFRAFKLKQSEAIKDKLDSLGFDVTDEETGGLIQEALEGRRSLMRAEKNELYEQATSAAKDIGDVPIFTDTIQEAIPDADTLEDLSITAPQAIKSLDLILTKYGLKDAAGEALETEMSSTPLSVSNFERFRKTLNAIERGDQTGAATVAIRPIKEALDKELNELGTVAAEAGIPENVLKPLLKARKTVRKIKTEFDPKSLTGKLADTKKNSVERVINASKTFDKIVAKSTDIEDVRNVVTALKKSPKGKEAIASLQASVIMDLINRGFTTESRKISGKNVFNPIAFRNRLKAFGEDKVKSIFSNAPATLKKLNNIENIAKELVPPSGAVPKGSSNILLDLANRLGLTAITAKLPGGALVIGALQSLAQPVKTGIDVSRALKAAPEVTKATGLIEQYFPGIAAAAAIPAVTERE